ARPRGLVVPPRGLAGRRRHAGDRAVRDLAVFRGYLLDLDHGDVLALDPDRVGPAAREYEHPVGPLVHQVLGVQPQVAPALQGGLGHPVVAAHHGPRLPRPQDQLADLAGHHLDVVFGYQAGLEVVAQVAAAGWLGRSDQDPAGLRQAVAHRDFGA